MRLDAEPRRPDANSVCQRPTRIWDAFYFGNVSVSFGTGAAGASSAAKPTVIVGTKNFTAAYVLGELYTRALQARGFTVKYKANIGSSELIETALESGSRLP
jgi:osmoprotectant transport system substrate-binding protein